MRPAFPCLPCSLFVLAFLSLPVMAEGGNPAGLTPLEDIPPPPTDIRPFDESIDEPQVTIRRDERGTVEEFRQGGKLYMLKITPESGAPYYLIDRSGNGQFEPVHHERDTGLNVPMWVIDTF
ncbi:MAG: DUF2782 domain-containing protein [Zoogloeaceae bacterium]|nr:DUF2782 domain-containing protein [Zoogloeaceae bacterium]